MTIDFVLEWENAGALEAEEALDFFKALTAHIDVLRGVVPGARVGFVIVFDSLPEPGLQTEIENRLFGDIGADRAVFLLADKADYYSKKQVAALHAQAELLIYCDSDCIYSPALPRVLFRIRVARTSSHEILRPSRPQQFAPPVRSAEFRLAACFRSLVV